MPGKKGGAHDMKFGFQMYYVRWHFQNNAQLNGIVHDPVEQLVQRRRPAHLSLSG